jgi:hypothetical protein
MTANSEIDNLFYLTDDGQTLPPRLTLLFHAAINGDEVATKGLVKEFTPSIRKIAAKVQSQNGLNDRHSFNLLIESGTKTLMDLMKKHGEEGFCKFILFAFRTNMVYTLATQKGCL